MQSRFEVSLVSKSRPGAPGTRRSSPWQVSAQAGGSHSLRGRPDHAALCEPAPATPQAGNTDTHEPHVDRRSGLAAFAGIARTRRKLRRAAANYSGVNLAVFSSTRIRKEGEIVNNIQLDHSHHRATPIKHKLCYLANDVDVPTNVGSLFRIADALGVEKIYLTGSTCVPPNTKIKKTSRSTEKFVEYSYTDNAGALVAQLKGDGYRIVSLEITSTSIPIEDFKAAPSERICLVLGSEDKGICQQLLDISDETIHIPMLGSNSSMNVASACSIATYQITRMLCHE
jgi:tRNA G18 (ribose-2'-O)-methylase SpoU